LFDDLLMSTHMVADGPDGHSAAGWPVRLRMLYPSVGDIAAKGVPVMMDLKPVIGAAVFAPVMPYSQGMVTQDFIFPAGQIGMDEAGDLPGPGVYEQTAQALSNLKAILEAAGSSLSRVVKVNAYLTDPDSWSDYNRAYVEAFGDHKPARTTVGVAFLAKGAVVEIEAVALKG
jgi:2-iminobutanoate/2-iminopropanoate deaminase